MANYQVADGWDNEAGFANFSTGIIEPRVEGLRDGRRRIAGDGLVYADGYKTAELVFDYLTKADKALIDADLGVDNATSNKITIKLPFGAARTFGNYNAIVESTDETVNARFERTKWLQVRYVLRRIHAT